MRNTYQSVYTLLRTMLQKRNPLCNQQLRVFAAHCASAKRGDISHAKSTDICNPSSSNIDNWYSRENAENRVRVVVIGRDEVFGFAVKSSLKGPHCAKSYKSWHFHTKLSWVHSQPQHLQSVRSQRRQTRPLLLRQSAKLDNTTATMGRLHSKGKGISASAIPYSRRVPTWFKSTPETVVDNICKLARKGATPSQIGVVLRDSHGVAQVKVVTGKENRNCWVVFKFVLIRRAQVTKS